MLYTPLSRTTPTLARHQAQAQMLKISSKLHIRNIGIDPVLLSRLSLLMRRISCALQHVFVSVRWTTPPPSPRVINKSERLWHTDSWGREGEGAVCLDPIFLSVSSLIFLVAYLEDLPFAKPSLKNTVTYYSIRVAEIVL